MHIQFGQFVPMTWRLPLLVLAGALAMSGAAPVEAQTEEQVYVSTDIAGARDMARNALSIGRPDQAVLVARQILAVVPDDPAAYLLLAAGLTRTGQAKDAIPAARKGFRLAEGKEQRFEGAYLTAEAFAAAGRPWASKLWLRRADLLRRQKIMRPFSHRPIATCPRKAGSVSRFRCSEAPPKT
ncbi:hypothetical protein MASR1M32_16900 [Rhodobacter sp.]